MSNTINKTLLKRSGHAVWEHEQRLLVLVFFVSPERMRGDGGVLGDLGRRGWAEA